MGFLDGLRGVAGGIEAGCYGCGGDVAAVEVDGLAGVAGLDSATNIGEFGVVDGHHEEVRHGRFCRAEEGVSQLVLPCQTWRAIVHTVAFVRGEVIALVNVVGDEG